MPLPYAIRTPRNIHVVTEGEKTMSLPSKSSFSPSFPPSLSLFFLSFSLLRPFYTMPLIIRRCRAAEAACSIENGIISGRSLILPRFAVVANGGVERGEGRRGRKREMRRKARDRQMPSERNSNFCAGAWQFSSGAVQ